MRSSINDNIQMKKLYILLLCASITTAQLLAQTPANDECIDAIPITNVSDWCSAADQFTSINATISPQPNPVCFPNNQEVYDVWYSFVAEAPVVSISVVGNTILDPQGTITDPQFALYEGDCNNLNALVCNSDNSDSNQAGAIESGLTVGETYYIRVSARYEHTGTFQICISNYNAVPPPDGDCPTAVILCDRSSFAVDFVQGVGNIPNEIGDVSCNSGTCDISESSSTWYKWTCDQPGPLAFTLTPANPNDDLDFVVYELPNGIDDCSGKVDLRCMASGENVGSPLADWVACTGPTGLSQTDNDQSETCGCQAGDNNFAEAIDMVAGRSYALVINNFSQSGAGFAIEFDQSPGTGTFVGPNADFTYQPDQVCVGEPVTFTDASSYIGNIDSYVWNFGQTATPSTITGQGPHSVSFNSPGMKSVVLEITAERGCIVTQIELTTEVVCCDDHFAVDAMVSDLDCPDSVDGVIDITVTNNYGPYGYTWSTGANTEDIAGLMPGTYTVTIVDEASCEDSFDFTVGAPPPFTFDTLITMPTCNGGTDGAVTLEVNGGTPPYEYNWEGAGFGPSNTLSNISQGDYTVEVRDANGCEFTQVMEVRELELALDPDVQAITQPSCFGFSDGSIQIVINNGLPPYTYDFGSGFGSSNTLNNIPAGNYHVDVLDANLCMGAFDLVVLDHPPLAIDLDVTHVSCFGESDGHIDANVSGGFGDYSYSWNNAVTTSSNPQLVAGDYSVTVLDENNCEITADATVTQPDSLGLGLVEVIDNICFGESEGSIEVAAVGGTPPYEYSIDGNNYQTDPILGNLPAGDYTVTVLDAMGCTATVDATVTEPIELIVEAGGDRLIVLGYDTIARATSNYIPVTYEWTPTDSLHCLNDDCSLVNLNPTSTTTYQVLVTNENGCTATDEFQVIVVKDRPYYAPNVFSPDGSGTNDGFTIFGGPGLEEIEQLQIFSRWGELVFETANILPNQASLGWDGKFNGEDVNPGIFVYVAQLRFVDQEVMQVEGDVMVLR